MKNLIGSFLNWTFELSRPIHRLKATGNQAGNLCRNPFSTLYALCYERDTLDTISSFTDYLHARKIHSRYFQLFAGFTHHQQINLIRETTARIRSALFEARRDDHNIGKVILTGRSAPLLRLANTYKTNSYRHYLELAELIARAEPDPNAANEALSSILYLARGDWSVGTRGRIGEYWRAHHELSPSIFPPIQHLAVPVLELVTTRLLLEQLQAQLPLDERSGGVFHELRGPEDIHYDSLSQKIFELTRSTLNAPSA